VQISVTGRHMQITDAIRNYAFSRVADAMEEFPRVETVHVILEIEKYRQRAEVVVQAAGHIRVEGREESDDLYMSIDGAVEKAERQLRRHRDKIQDHRTRESVSQVEIEAQSRVLYS